MHSCWQLICIVEKCEIISVVSSLITQWSRFSAVLILYSVEVSDKPNENEPNSDISPPVRRAHTQNTEQISTTRVWKMALDAKNKTKKQAYYSSSEYNLMRILALVSGNYGKALMSTQGFRV